MIASTTPIQAELPPLAMSRNTAAEAIGMSPQPRSEISDVQQDLDSVIRDDELTFAGDWAHQAGRLHGA